MGASVKERCVIIAAHCEGAIRDLLHLTQRDYIICADGGYAFAQREGILPDLIIGDFDSFAGELPQGVEIERVAAEKDDTDTMLCLKRGIQRGFEEFILLGGLGGRLDHTIANLQTLAYGHERGCFVLLMDQKMLVSMVGPGRASIPRREGYGLSIFAFGGPCEGVCENGVKYPLHNARLDPAFPLGVSNEFVSPTAEISCATGRLLVMLYKKE